MRLAKSTSASAGSLLERYSAVARVRARRPRRKGRDFYAGPTLRRGAQVHPVRRDALALTDPGSTPSATPDARLAIDTATASVGFVITTACRDRQGDVVVPTGCLPHLDSYRANPQVFFAHRSDEYPIAKARRHRDDDLALWADEAKVLSRAYFHLKTRESEEVFGLIVDDVLRTTSIGFLPVRGRLIEEAFDVDAAEQGEPFEFDFGGITFLEWQLLEWSVVPVPANPEALRAQLSRRSFSPSLRKSLEPFAEVPRNDRVRLLRTTKPSSSASPPVTPKMLQDSPFDKIKAAINSEPAVPGSHDPDKPEETPSRPGDECDVQSVEFDPSRFRDEAMCREWLEENGLGECEVMPPEKGDGEGEEPGPFLAMVFDASECEAESHRVQEPEEGVKLHCCKRAASSDDEEDADKGDEPGNSDGESDKKGKKPFGDGDGDGDEKPDEEPDGEPDGDESDEGPGKKPRPSKETLRPYGCEVLTFLAHHLDEVLEYLTEAGQVLEQPQVLKYCERFAAVTEKSLTDLLAFGRKIYPDHFDEPVNAGNGAIDEPAGDGDGDETPEDKLNDDGEVEMAAANTRRKALSKAQATVVGEAADCFEELSVEDTLKRYQRTACRAHAQALRGLQQSPQDEDETRSSPSRRKSPPAEDPEVLRKLQSQYEDLARRYYEQTGETL